MNNANRGSELLGLARLVLGLWLAAFLELPETQIFSFGFKHFLAVFIFEIFIDKPIVK